VAPFTARTRGVALAAASAVTLLGTRANAQVADGNGDGLDTHLFRPALDSKGFFTINGSDILGKNDISFGLVLDYGRNLLRVNDVGQKSPQIVNHSFQGTAMFNYGIANVAVVGLDVPVNLMAGDEQVTPTGAPAVPGWGTSKLDSQTFGFLALHGKVRITRVEKGPGLGMFHGQCLRVPAQRVFSEPLRAGLTP